MAMLALAWVALGCSGSDSDATNGVTVRNGDLSMVIPATWDQEPAASQLEVWSETPDIQSENCERGRSTVIVHVSQVAADSVGASDQPRPTHFDKWSGTGLQENIADLGDCGALSQWIPFAEGDNSYAVAVTLGKDVTPSQRTTAYRVLDTLRVGPPSGEHPVTE